MYSAEDTAQAIGENIILSRGKFRLSSKGIREEDRGEEIPLSDILIPFIDGIDERWPYDTEPTPRVAGQLIELLRGCRFLKDVPRGEIRIIPDRERARNLGAFDTPQVVVDFIVNAVVGSLCEAGKRPVILDPACGAGYFLLAAVDALIAEFPGEDPIALTRDSIVGFDLDDVAVALTKRNLQWHLQRVHGIVIPDKVLDGIILKADALSEIERLPIKADSIDGIMGNPPYQFFSGRGSPVASLKKAGKLDEARILEKELDELTARFPRTSHGCRDRYKWFVDRAVELTRPDGMLGFITPNTWIAYPRYRDFRFLLSGEGRFESVIDLGSLAFKQAHVPASVMIWRKSMKQNGFPFLKLDSETWRDALNGDDHAIGDALMNAPRFEIDRSAEFSESSEERLGRNSLSKHIARLGEIAVLREGSHAISAVPLDCPDKPSPGCDYPVLVDKSMDDLIPPRIGYTNPPGPKPRNVDIHSGRRFLIRKTGDRLVVAPSPTDDFALAHQNVYVGKVKSDSISFPALVGILASDYMTNLYRTGPGGQHHRPLAQLRIHFLKDLPIVIIPDVVENAPKPSGDKLSALISSVENGKMNEIEPVPQEFPSDYDSVHRAAEQIGLYHAAIEAVVLRYIEHPDEKLKHTLDILVNHLYDNRSEK